MKKIKQIKPLKTEIGKGFEKTNGYEMEPNYTKMTNQIVLPKNKGGKS